MSQLKLRDDLDIDLIQEFDSKYIYISDPLLIAEPIALPFAYYPLIQTLMKGEKTADSIVKDETAKLLNISEDKVHTLIKNLKALYILESDITRMAVQNMQNYIDGSERNSYCHGFSYPEKVDELNAFLDIILDKGKSESVNKIKAILAPHIDLRLEESWEVYANSFLPLEQQEDIDTIILLGTAHYRSSADFMFTNKDFVTPLGKSKIDNDLLTEIQNNISVNFDDIAHYKEHSIEFHQLFVQKLLPNKNVKILPILTGSPSNYFAEKNLPEENENYNNTIRAIQNAINKLGRKVLVLSSGDLSHVGRKFGDEFDATNERERIRKEDKLLISKLELPDKNSFFEEIAKANDKNRICGTSPYYSALALCNSDVTNVGYNQWYEEETESMVSFAGFLVK